MRAPRAKLRLPSGSEAAAAKWYLQPRENVINLQGCVTGFNAGVCFFVQDYGMGGSSSRRPQCVCHHELPGIYGGSIKLGSRALKSACTRCQTCAPRLKLRSAPRPRLRRRHPPRPAGWRHSRRSRSPPAGMLSVVGADVICRDININLAIIHAVVHGRKAVWVASGIHIHRVGICVSVRLVQVRR